MSVDLIKDGIKAGSSIVWHQIRRAFGVFAVVSICWYIYVGAIKPHVNPTETMKQQADKIQNNYITEIDDKFFIGIKLFGIKIGISKPVHIKKPVIKEMN